MDYSWMQFEKKKGIPLYKQIHDFFVKQMIEGYLKQGDKLPSIRKCATILQVSLTSIKNAYALLEEEGYLKVMAQKGYYVQVSDDNLKLRKEVLSSLKQEDNKHILYDFRTSGIDEESFDTVNWKRCVKSVLKQGDLLNYGDVQGEAILRKALQQYAYSYRGILCHSDQIVVGASVQVLLYQLCGLLPKNQMIYFDDPPFPQAKQVFEDCAWNVKICELSSLQNFNDVSFIYLNTASFGKERKPMSKATRKKYCELAKQHQIYLIEDDKNGELCYLHRSESALQSYDSSGKVIYIGTFSKLLAPSLRIAYMILPEELKKRFIKNRYYNPTASKMEQLALAEYFIQSHMERHLNQLRKRYLSKYQTMKHLLKEYVPHWKWILNETGLRIHIKKTSMNNQVLPKEIAYDETPSEIIFSFAKISVFDMKQAIVLLSEYEKSK